jgi:hypothetical protein
MQQVGAFSNLAGLFLLTKQIVQEADQPYLALTTVDQINRTATGWILRYEPRVPPVLLGNDDIRFPAVRNNLDKRLPGDPALAPAPDYVNYSSKEEDKRPVCWINPDKECPSKCFGCPR